MVADPNLHIDTHMCSSYVHLYIHKTTYSQALLRLARHPQNQVLLEDLLHIFKFILTMTLRKIFYYPQFKGKHWNSKRWFNWGFYKHQREHAGVWKSIQLQAQCSLTSRFCSDSDILQPAIITLSTYLAIPPFVLPNLEMWQISEQLYQFCDLGELLCTWVSSSKQWEQQWC